MDRQFVINITKDLLLVTKKADPVFLVDRGGSLADMDATWCNNATSEISEEVCLTLGRQRATECCWNLESIKEVAYTGTQKQQGREYLIVAFCTPLSLPEPAFTLHRIEVRRDNRGNIALIDTGESTSEEHRQLLWFTTGIMTSPLPLEEINAVIATIKATKE